jgi:hypothetical protein
MVQTSVERLNVRVNVSGVGKLMLAQYVLNALFDFHAAIDEQQLAGFGNHHFLQQEQFLIRNFADSNCGPHCNMFKLNQLLEKHYLSVFDGC